MLSPIRDLQQILLKKIGLSTKDTFLTKLILER